MDEKEPHILEFTLSENHNLEDLACLVDDFVASTQWLRPLIIRIKSRDNSIFYEKLIQ